jgi:hypothetical protein
VTRNRRRRPVTKFPDSEWNTPAYLQQLMPLALKLTLAEGEKKVQDLVIASQ